jgi:hypothetical protein
MALAIVRRLFNNDRLEIQDLNTGADTGATLSPKDLAQFKELLNRYAKGDMHTRLNLWLYHRDLRKAFEVLDQHQ